MKTTTYQETIVRKWEVVRVTHENLDEVAAWCGEKISPIGQSNGVRWVNVGPDGWRADVGHLIAKSRQGIFRVWTDSERFHRRFERVEAS